MSPNISPALRSVVFTRANGCCEYCLIHMDDVPDTHEADHLVARKHGGQSESENLALACLPCNRRKGSDLTAIDPATQEIVPLFNSRKQDWGDHFVLDGPRIVGLTPVGRATVALLRFNDSVRLDNRQRLLDAGRYPPQYS